MNNSFAKLKAILTQKSQGMPTHAQLNAVSPGAHVPKLEAPIAVANHDYKPEAFGESLEQKYQALQRVLRKR